MSGLVDYGSSDDEAADTRNEIVRSEVREQYALSTNK